MPFTTSQTTRLQHQLEGLIDWLNELSDTRLKQEITPGKWTIWQNAAHLISYQNVFLSRMKKLLAEDNPTFDRFVPDFDPQFLEYQQLDKQTLIQKGTEIRTQINTLLFSLNETQLHRTAQHPLYGNNTLLNWTEFFLLHEAHHLFTIFKLKQTPQ